MSEYNVEAIVNENCELGENPLWDHDQQCLYWTDITRGELFRYNAETARSEKIYSGEPVGGFTLQADGTLLLFRTNEIACRRKDGAVEILRRGIDDGMKRFNDVIADPQGRVFAGTMGKSDTSGGLYCIDIDGTAKRLFLGTGCSNGMAFSSDRRRFWWTCSTSRRIWLFDYDQRTGELSNRRLFLDLSGEEGAPDGLTVDSNDFVYSARWDGFGIYIYSQRGELVEKILTPAAKVTSVIFGGRNLDELYITTAGGQVNSKAADGTLYRVRVSARGLSEFRSRILL
jgi:D-xylonolactonase